MIKPQCCIAFWAILGAASPALLAQSDRITSRIDSSQSVVMAGRVPRQATAQNDTGPVENSFRLSGITLMVKPSAAQQTDLNQLLLAQQDSTSPNYHQWLTPEQYADRFGAGAGDLAKIAAWLESQGFSVDYVARSRNYIAFSGTAQQVASAFHTQIHRYTVNGVTHYANATDPSIPAALAGLVSGIRGLNDFRPKPQYKLAHPQATLGRTTVVGPADFAAIYDVKPLYSESVNGTLINGAGQKIVIVGQSEIKASDISSFRSHFGLVAANLTLKVVPYNQTYPDGGNPGYVPGDEMESDLDVEWSGAVAPNVSVIFVYSGDVWTSAQYAIDQNVAPVLSMSYGNCEASDLADLDTYRSIVQQGNAEGITMLAAAGDAGAADCDGGENVAESGLAVDAPGSIPEVTSMGGTQFNEQRQLLDWRRGYRLHSRNGVERNGGISAAGQRPAERWRRRQHLFHPTAVAERHRAERRHAARARPFLGGRRFSRSLLRLHERHRRGAGRRGGGRHIVRRAQHGRHRRAAQSVPGSHRRHQTGRLGQYQSDPVPAGANPEQRVSRYRDRQQHPTLLQRLAQLRQWLFGLVGRSRLRFGQRAGLGGCL